MPLTQRQRIALALTIAICLIVSSLIQAAWPATASSDPVTVPTTYGPPGPDGGPQ